MSPQKLTLDDPAEQSALFSEDNLAREELDDLRETKEDTAVQTRQSAYCACAFLDLQGFAAHLAAGGHEIRHGLGANAVSRLLRLEEVMERMEVEPSKLGVALSMDCKAIRINDALVFTMDLDDSLAPRIGERIPSIGTSATKDIKLTAGLRRFVGFVARAHCAINTEELGNSLPGCKTIICTGFRTRFSSKYGEDQFSANFAFANAYSADESLKGSRFFLEDNVARLIELDVRCKNLLRFAALLGREPPYNPFEENLPNFKDFSAQALISAVFMHREFHYLSVDASPLTHLQFLDLYSNAHNLSGKHSCIADAIKRGPFSSDTKQPDHHRICELLNCTMPLGADPLDHLPL